MPVPDFGSDERSRALLTRAVELRGERMHVACMTEEEQRATVFILNMDRMRGRVCGRCGITYGDEPA